MRNISRSLQQWRSERNAVTPFRELAERQAENCGANRACLSSAARIAALRAL